MTLKDLSRIASAKSVADLYRDYRTDLKLATSVLDHGANIRRLLDQENPSTRVVQGLSRDPYRDLVQNATKRINGQDGFGSTARAIEQAQRHRELTVKALARTDLLDQRRLAAGVLDSGFRRTAELLSRNQSSIAAAIAAARPRDELADLASSLVRRMETLRFANLGRSAFPKSIAEQYAQEFASARRAAEQFETAQTDEERAALLSILLAAVLAVMRGIASNTRKEVIGMGLFMLFSLACDVNSLIPQETLPGMTPAQVQELEETHRTAKQLVVDFAEFAKSDRRLDEAYVANLPRAELARPAIIRAEPNGKAKALWRAPTDTLLAVAERRGRWTLATYRDPLTDELAQGWIHGPAVRMLDDE